MLTTTAYAQVATTGPFTGDADLREGWVNGPGGFPTCIDFMTTGTACSGGFHTTGGWGYQCSIGSYNTSMLAASSNGPATLTFPVPVQSFGGYFGSNANISGGQFVTYDFYDAAGNLIDSVVESLGDCGTYKWFGWESTTLISSVVITNAENGGAYVMMDDLEATRCPLDDRDCDGVPAASDCDDFDPLVSTPGIEICNGVDDDCDGIVDNLGNGDMDGDGVDDLCDVCQGDDATGDADGDGVCADQDPCPDDNPNDSDGDRICDSDDQCVGNDRSGDTDGDGVCDDTDACTGDDTTGDVDADGYCADVDCDDTSADTYPGAQELCDGLDNPCNGSVPADEIDADGDGFATCEDDCDDTAPTANPAESETCDDQIDNDCDGVVDEDCDEEQTPEDTGDTDEPGDEAPTPEDGVPYKGGCGCSASTPLSGVLVPSLLGILAVRRRREA